MKVFVTIISLLTIFTFTQAQVMTDFDSDSLAGWRSEGDGNYLLEMDTGNPGNCMRVNDDATGDLNIAIAPLQFLGNWSVADTMDSIITDVFVNQINGSVIENPWIFRISGPGGSATSMTFTLSMGEWNHLAVPMDSASWKVTAGNWFDLMEYINHLEVRAEYISGDEYVLLDNIGLTFSPLIVPINPPVISDFENGSYEGWTFENSGGVSNSASGGNPGRYIRISDGPSFTQAIAPPKFLGDWSNLNNQAALMFDLKISNFSGPFIIDDFLIKISGPGGAATIPMDSLVMNAANQWYTLSYMIAENDFSIVSGDWNSLLTDVRELRVLVEYISGSEIIWFDNFRISTESPIADFTADPLFVFPGEGIQFSDLSLNAPSTWEWDFGDGESSSEQDPFHNYMQPGVYDVGLIISNNFGSDTLTLEDYIEVAGLSDSILFEDDFDDNEIHPAWRFRNGTWQEKNANISQTSNYYSGGYGGGCYALVGSPQWEKYGLLVDFNSSDDDKIGVVFNYQDADNFYLFTWQLQGTHRAVKKFIDGEWTNIAVDTVGYEKNRWYHLNLTTDDGQIEVYIDSALVFSVKDSVHLSGKAGLYCHGNQSSFWDNFKIVNLNYQSTTIPALQTEIVSTFTLNQNYPNPFNPSTRISYTIPGREHVLLEVYNTIGQRVRILTDREMEEGSHSVEFRGDVLPTGVYFYRIKTRYFEQVRKMILLR